MFRIKGDELLRLKKPSYGIYDAGDCLVITMENDLVNDLEMSPVIEDAALYVKCKNGKLNGICGMYVDES